MKFKTIAEAFNYYRNATLEEIERRAAEIKGTIETRRKRTYSSRQQGQREEASAARSTLSRVQA